MDVIDKLKSGKIKIIVKTNSPKDQILGWDESKQAFRIAISAPAEDNKANIAIIKFFSKLVGQKVRIVTGLKSKKKKYFLRKLSELFLNNHLNSKYTLNPCPTSI